MFWTLWGSLRLTPAVDCALCWERNPFHLLEIETGTTKSLCGETAKQSGDGWAAGDQIRPRLMWGLFSANSGWHTSWTQQIFAKRDEVCDRNFLRKKNVILHVLFLTISSSLPRSLAQAKNSSYFWKGMTGSGSSLRYSFSREATVCTSVLLLTETRQWHQWERLKLSFIMENGIKVLKGTQNKAPSSESKKLTYNLNEERTKAQSL